MKSNSLPTFVSSVCFVIPGNAEITAVGLQTLKQTSIMSSERKKRREAEQRQIQHNLTHQTAEKRQKNILDYYRLREQRCILKMIPPLICKHPGILVVKGEIIKSS